MGDNVAILGLVLLGLLWLAQLVWLYRDSQNRRADPIHTVSGAATFFVFAAPMAVFAPSAVDSAARFWAKVSAPVERALGGGSGRGHGDANIPARLLINGESKSLTMQRVRLGRYPNNEIVLDHSTVSAYHAEIIQRPDGRHEILDRESRNGTRVNGALVRNQVLREGDLITLGAASMHYLSASRGETFPPADDDAEDMDAYEDERERRAYSRQTIDDGYE